MGSLTNYGEETLLNHVFGRQSYIPKTSIYLALFTADPTDVGLLTNEPSRSNGYSRTEITFSVAASRTIIQTPQVTFPQCSGGGWGTITYWGITDSLTDGNMLAHGAFNESLETSDGFIIKISDTDIQISITSGSVSNYLANILLDFMFRNVIYIVPNIYLGLCDATPVDGDTGSTISELIGDNYSRKDFSDWAEVASGSLKNNTDIVFATPSSVWNTVTHSVVCDASSDGNLLFFGEALPNQAPPSGDPVKFLSNTYLINLS